MADGAEDRPDTTPETIAAAVVAALTAGGSQVTYRVGDLLDRLGTRVDAGFAEVKALMATKADKADLVRIETRLDEHGREIGRIKEKLREDEVAERALSRSSQRRIGARQWRTATLISLLGAVAAVGFLIAAILHL